MIDQATVFRVSDPHQTEIPPSDHIQGVALENFNSVMCRNFSQKLLFFKQNVIFSSFLVAFLAF
jgi:hypothetical protein